MTFGIFAFINQNPSKVKCLYLNNDGKYKKESFSHSSVFSARDTVNKFTSYWTQKLQSNGRICRIIVQNSQNDVCFRFKMLEEKSSQNTDAESRDQTH